MRASANAEPESDVAHISPPDPSRQHRGDTANAKKTDSSVRIGQGSNGKANAAKRVSQTSIDKEERALFDEFLRWRERQKTVNTAGQRPSVRP
jgi:hypothetical protein